MKIIQTKSLRGGEHLIANMNAVITGAVRRGGIWTIYFERAKK